MIQTGRIEHPEDRPAWLGEWPDQRTLQAMFSAGIRRYGARELSLLRRIGLDWDETGLQADLGGRRVVWALERGQWRRRCSCGYTSDCCAHAYAAAGAFAELALQKGWLTREGRTAAARRPATDAAHPPRERPKAPDMRQPPLFGAVTNAAPGHNGLEAEADLLHDRHSVTLRFYHKADGMRRLLRMQQVHRLCVRARHSSLAESEWPEDDLKFMRWLQGRISRSSILKQNLQVLKLDHIEFDEWLELWSERPGRFIDRATQTPLTSGDQCASLHFELHPDPDPDWVRIDAVVTGTQGRARQFHEIFDLLAGGKGHVVVDGEFLSFACPIDRGTLEQCFARKSPRIRRKHVVQHLPTLLEERLDLLHGPLVERRTRTAPLEISVREDGSDLVFGVRVGGKPLQDAERAVASGIEPRGERFVVTEFTSAEVETLKDILRRLAALRRGGGEFAVAMIPTLMFVLREEWPALIRLGTVEVAPSLRPLLQGELELRATLTLRDDGRFTDAGVLWYAGDVALTDHEVRDLARSHGGFLRSRSGTWFRADPTQVQAVVREIEGLGLDTGASTRLLRPEARSLLEKIPADANLALADSAQPLAERILRTPLDPPLALPEHLEPVLRPYQKHGFEFLSDRQRYRVGAVLADDMGLGKTLQVLSLLEAFYASGPRAHSGAERLRSLVICPASVVMVWVQQAALFCPGLRCRAYQGNPETRAEILGADDWDVLVLNYALARNDSEALLGAAYQFVVLDEAQQIKNPDSQIAQVSRSLRANQPLALTGTPLENRLLDLWSIMEFVNPGFLGSRQAFLDRYDNPAGYQRLAHRIRPAILRRTKELVAPELPPRTEEVVVVEMGSEQRRLYEAERQQARELLRTRGPVEVLAALTRLRQFCCHPDLVLKNGKVDQAAKVDELCDRLEELLAENHSVLVFSQFTEMLKRLEPVLEARGMPFLKITGSTPAPERARLVEAFNSSDQAQVFLLSLRAAGTGLTLTRADYVFIFDPWWNPAVERQAIDRTHRIGQDKPVFAYRLVAQGTVEERVLALQAEKARLSAEVLADTDSGGGFAQRLTREDLERLLE